MKERAVRFIDAYNVVDNAMRLKFNYHPNTSFSDAVRRSAQVDPVVRKYEAQLIDFARLRNAIVHRSIGEVVIADPHEDVVLEFEHIARLMSTPPLAIDCLKKRNVISFQKTDSLKKVISEMEKFGFSIAPVIENRKIVGVVSDKRILRAIGRAMLEGEDIDVFLAKKEAKDVVFESDFMKLFAIKSEKATIAEIVDLFEKTRSLAAVILTKNGTNLELPKNIVTVTDLVMLSKVLEDY